MERSIRMLVVVLTLGVFMAGVCESYDDRYHSPCDVPGACQAWCEDGFCYYYDDDGDCWQYDERFGFYPCDCDCYGCDDDWCDDDCWDDPYGCDCDHCHHYHDHDDYWHDWSCFIDSLGTPLTY